MTWSAFRLVKYALDLKRPVVILNDGPTRADVHLQREFVLFYLVSVVGEI